MNERWEMPIRPLDLKEILEIELLKRQIIGYPTSQLMSVSTLLEYAC